MLATRHNFRLFVCLCALVLGTGACTDDRNATTHGELFHCSTGADCLTGWSCICGYCQEPGAIQLACTIDSDASGGDAQLGTDTSADDSSSGTDATVDTSTPDVGPTDTTTADSGALDPNANLGICGQKVGTDVVAGPCNLTDWSGCPDSSYACYYAPAFQQSICKKHAAIAENAACEPCNLSECGGAADGRPLICDVVDKKCYRTCNWQNLNAFPCPSGFKCYKLTDASNVEYPNGAGICAP